MGIKLTYNGCCLRKRLLDDMRSRWRECPCWAQNSASYKTWSKSFFSTEYCSVQSRIAATFDNASRNIYKALSMVCSTFITMSQTSMVVDLTNCKGILGDGPFKSDSCLIAMLYLRLVVFFSNAVALHGQLT